MERRGAQLFAQPLATWERDGLKAALKKMGLPATDIEAPDRLFWRFEKNDVPVGFGGLEIHGDLALLRSVVTLPPLRKRGLGRAITAMLEVEARGRGCRAVYLLTIGEGRFFARLGYEPCNRDDVPAAIGATEQFTSLCPASATVMVKRF